MRTLPHPPSPFYPLATPHPPLCSPIHRFKQHYPSPSGSPIVAVAATAATAAATPPPALPAAVAPAAPVVLLVGARPAAVLAATPAG